MNAHIIVKNIHWLIICVLLNAASQVIMKLATQSRPIERLFEGDFWSSLWGFIINPYYLGAMILLIVSTFSWLKLINQVPLSIAYPSLSLSFAFTLILGHFIFHEPITMLKIIGILFITGGVTCVAFG